MTWFSATLRIACMIEPDGLSRYMAVAKRDGLVLG